MLVKVDPGTHYEDMEVLQTVLEKHFAAISTIDKHEMLLGVVALLVERGVLSLIDLRAFGLPHMEEVK